MLAGRAFLTVALPLFYNAGSMKIGYIASHIYLHTFEINEASELVRQHPEARVYSFYRPRGSQLQRHRAAEI